MKHNDFFAQSYKAALKDYIYSCINTKVHRWDWVILTAANNRQADAYRLQISKRKNENRLPVGTKFAVVPDYKEQRIGSGGATLNVIRHLSDEIGVELLLQQKILVIHSGGNSKRIPQYSVCGKLFAPVPRMLPNGYVSTIFDELMIAATDIPNRCKSGMMIFPSDTELLFNSLQLDLLSCDAAGLSVKVPVLEGQEHGVFLQGTGSNDHRNRNVAKFLHKQPETLLKSSGAVDSANQVDIDTGCIWFSSRIIRELFGLISEGGKVEQRQFEQFVNPKVCLNFYADFVYPLAENSTLDEFYQETPENGYSNELNACRREIWERLHHYRLSLVKMVPARYIHFGMTYEMYELFVDDIGKYAYLGWERKLITNANSGTVINSYISSDSQIADSSYVEDSVLINSTVGERTILSNVYAEGVFLPSDIVLHGLALKNGKFVCRIYGKGDNPKSSANASFLNGTIAKLIEKTGIQPEDIWGKATPSIWNAKIYPECSSFCEAVKFALCLYRMIQGSASDSEINNWKQSKRYSLCSSFQEADITAMLERQNQLREQVKIQSFMEQLNNGQDMGKTISELKGDAVDASNYIRSIAKYADEAEFPQNMRLYLACGDICSRFQINNKEQSYFRYEDLAYAAVSNTIRNETFARFPSSYGRKKFVVDAVTTELPVRVNFCGSPSDAAPYCLEHGGTMLDGALLLNGEKPIKVTVTRLKEKEIRFGSLDQGCFSTITDIQELQNCGDPFDPYALHKAVLIATGIIPYDQAGVTIDQVCSQFGGGVELLTKASVPKGSGLGTSSIIAATAVKAVNEMCGVKATNEMVYAQVFLAEQLMATGGGWQDQVGGLTSGIKYITTLPGGYQEISVDHLELPKDTMEELNSRFVLVFSGQRRLARNVLREEMNQCIRNNKKALQAVKTVQEYCAIMRHYLLKKDITSFASYITKQFELVKQLDKGASNTCIEYIFNVCDDLIDGKSICGAGGGGFLQMVLKEGISKKVLKQRIQEVFADCGVEVWDCELI